MERPESTQMNQYNEVLVAQITAAINSEHAPREENERLYPAVAGGDEDAINRMIEINMPFVLSRAESYLAAHPDYSHLRDDLVAEGFYRLTWAVRKMAQKGPVTDSNVTGYISFWITKAMGTVAEQENRTTGPSESARRRSDVELPHQVPMPDPLIPGRSDKSVDPMALTDLRDLIHSCCETDADRMIITLAEQGHTDTEIAQAIDTPITTAYLLRRAIYARFLTKSGMPGEV